MANRKINPWNKIFKFKNLFYRLPNILLIGLKQQYNNPKASMQGLN